MTKKDLENLKHRIEACRIFGEPYWETKKGYDNVMKTKLCSTDLDASIYYVEKENEDIIIVGLKYWSL